jgi:hypothetical protein
MRNPMVLSTLALIGLLAGTAGCDRTKAPAADAEKTAAETSAPTAVPPSLWRIDVLSDGAVTGSVNVCADERVAEGFKRPAPDVSGKPCLKVGEAVETDGSYSVRCRVDDQLYRVGSTVQGDPTREFTVEMAVTRQDQKGPMFQQTRSYHRVGPCPAGWEVGDSGAPDAAEAVNTLTGKARSLSAPAQ